MNGPPQFPHIFCKMMERSSREPTEPRTGGFLMHRLGAVIGIAIAGAALSTPSQAREIRTFPFAGWTVGVYTTM
jgi:hypothetical protein